MKFITLKKILRKRFNLILLILSISNEKLFALDYSYIGLFERAPFTELNRNFFTVTNTNNGYLFPSKIFAVDKVKFVINNIALINIDGSITQFTIGNDNHIADIKINELIVPDYTYGNASFLLLRDDQKYDVNVKVTEFEIKNSKVGTLIILNGGTNSKTVNISAKDSLKISNNDFLNSFIVAGSENSGNIINIFGRDTNISENTIRKPLKGKGKIIIGDGKEYNSRYNDSITTFSKNLADITYPGGYLIESEDSIGFLGRVIKIENNIGGLLKTKNENIEIGGEKTSILIIEGGSGGMYDSFAFSENSNIFFKADYEGKNPNFLNSSMSLKFDKNNLKHVLLSNNCEISMSSRDIRLNGYYKYETNDSVLESFMSGNKLTLKFGFLDVSQIMLKDDKNVFFDFSGDMNFDGTKYNWSNIIVSSLKAKKDGNYDGGIFKTSNGNISLTMDQFSAGYIDAPNTWVFRQENNNGKDTISINKIYIQEPGNNIAGFYYSKGNSFKMHGMKNENSPLSFDYRATINGLAVIKIGSEESNANGIQYEKDPFFMNISNLFVWPYKIGENVIAGIVLTNPKFIETDGSGTVTKENGNLKILISSNTLDLNTRSLYFDFDKPAIAVIANKQEYGDGKNKKVFEFGETIIEGSSDGGKKELD